MELNKQISKHNYNAFLWHAVFLALASNFMDVGTIIPAMMIDAGSSSFQLGVLTAIMLGGGKLAQLIFASFLSNQSSKKAYLLGGVNARVFALGGMALLFWFSPHIDNVAIIWFIFILITLFSFGGAFANINYVDILGKSVLQEKRKAFFSIKQVISSLVVLVSAFFVKRILITNDYPLNYAVLFFIAAAFLGIASLGFWKIKEISAPNLKITGFRKFIRIVISEIRTNKKLRNYLLITNTQGIVVGFMPFLVLYAKKMFAAGSQNIGNFLILKVIGGVLTGSILFYYSRKVKYQTMLYITSVIAILIPLYVLFLPGAEYFPYIFLAGGIILTIYSVSSGGVLLEVTTNENRALFTGLSGVGGILPVVFPFLGGWLITEFGFSLFFALFIAVMTISFYFIHKMGCKQ